MELTVLNFYLFLLVLLPIFIIIFKKIVSKLFESLDIQRNVSIAFDNNINKTKDGGFEIRSRNVYITYNKMRDKLICNNLKNKKQSFYIDDASLIRFNKSDIYGLRDVDVKGVQDVILYLFEPNFKYDDILTIFRVLKINIIDDSIYSSNKAEEKVEKKKTEYTININSATVDEIARLPGINVVQAKKAIRYREENGGFKTKVEFYTLLKLKEHFIKEIENIIAIGEMDGQTKYIDNCNEDRTVDF